MSRFTTICLPAWLRPARFVRDRGGVPRDPDPREVLPPCARDAADRAERLERIAMYARAGYFHIGYTLDMMQMAADIPPD
jgi:hypothetical protein